MTFNYVDRDYEKRLRTYSDGYIKGDKCLFYIKVGATNVYGAPFWQKLITFMHTKVFCDIKVFFVQHKIFLMNTTYIYIQHELFYQHVFLFYATLNRFSQHESLFLVSHNFFCCHNMLSCDSHNFGGQLNFYVKYFFC